MRRGELGGVQRSLRRLRQSDPAGPLEDLHAAAMQEVPVRPGRRACHWR